MKPEALTEKKLIQELLDQYLGLKELEEEFDDPLLRAQYKVIINRILEKLIERLKQVDESKIYEIAECIGGKSNINIKDFEEIIKEEGERT